MTRAYPTLRDGERKMLPGVRGTVIHKLACCDCKLVHRVRLRVVPSGIELTAWRDKRATAARRRRYR